MKRGRLLWSMAPAISPKLALFTSEIGPLKNCGELKALMKSVRKIRATFSVSWLFFMMEMSELCTPGRRTLESRVFQVWNVYAGRTVHAGCSLPLQSSVVPFASCVHELNHCA